MREAEVSEVRPLAKGIEPEVGLVTLASKLFSDLSLVDIALSLDKACPN